jgi:hypothetical protein
MRFLNSFYHVYQNELQKCLDNLKENVDKCFEEVGEMSYDPRPLYDYVNGIKITIGYTFPILKSEAKHFKNKVEVEEYFKKEFKRLCIFYSDFLKDMANKFDELITKP